MIETLNLSFSYQGTNFHLSLVTKRLCLILCKRGKINRISTINLRRKKHMPICWVKETEAKIKADLEFNQTDDILIKTLNFFTLAFHSPSSLWSAPSIPISNRYFFYWCLLLSLFPEVPGREACFTWCTRRKLIWQARISGYRLLLDKHICIFRQKIWCTKDYTFNPQFLSFGFRWDWHFHY